MRILGIDWGKKKIGLAIANSISKNITVIGTFSNDSLIFNKIKEIILRYEIKKIVIGKPVLTKTYQEAPIFNEINIFSKNLSQFLKNNNLSIDIDYIEEEYTTLIANQLINYFNFKKNKNKLKNKFKNKVDGLSALLILRSYINF